MPVLGDGDAVVANAAGRDRDAAVAVRAHAVERPGDDAGRRGLADAAHPGQHIGMRDPAAFEWRSKAFGPGHPGRSVRRKCSAGISGRGRDRRRVSVRCHEAGLFSRCESCCGLPLSGGRLDTRPEPVSLRLLPSGSDRVGEGLVRRPAFRGQYNSQRPALAKKSLGPAGRKLHSSGNRANFAAHDDATP